MEIKEVSLVDVRPDPEQPRRFFDEEKLRELKESIEKHGLINPITVRSDEHDSSKFIIVAGERRYKALSELAKEHEHFEKGFVVVIEKNDYQALSLIENIQRENLNPVELAKGLAALKEAKDITQEKLSELVGKSPSTISEILSINKLPEKILNDAINRNDVLPWVLTAVAKCEDESAKIAEWDKLKEKKITRNVYRAEKSKQKNAIKKLTAKDVINVFKNIKEQFRKFDEAEHIEMTDDDRQKIKDELKSLRDISQSFFEKYDLEENITENPLHTHAVAVPQEQTELAVIPQERNPDNETQDDNISTQDDNTA